MSPTINFLEICKLSIERIKKINDFINLLKELSINLKNTHIIQALEENNFDLESLKNAIQIYTSNENYITDDLLYKLVQKTNDLLKYTNESNFYPYYTKFLNPANYLIEFSKEIEIAQENKILDDLLDDVHPLNQISEEEFSIRYENLIDALKFEGEESNLSLVTASGKVSFQVYKTSNRSLAFLTRGGSINKATKAKLINLVYHNGNAKNLSYEPVIIEKILDNSIFNEIKNTQHIDLTEALREQLTKQKDELFIVKNELEKLQKNEEELSTVKMKLAEVVEQSKLALKEYEDAKEAVLKDFELKESVNYWNNKQSRHKRRFFMYGGSSIVLIFVLIFALKILISNHSLDTTFNDNNISKIVTLKSNTQDNDKKNEDFLQNSLAYIHFFGWYALLIFASSSILWIIRIVVKIALSNLHLSEDAYERVVMIQTYLAFIKEGHGLEENDKQLILSSLFRPSNIGIIKDESSISIGDIISSLKAK